MDRYALDSDKNKWIDAVGKLISLTQEGRLTWRTQLPSPDVLSSTGKNIDVVYETDYKNKRLRVYESKVYSPIEEPSYYLELIEPTTNAVWSFPSTVAIGHLMTAVKYQTTGVKRFLDELLAEAV